MLEKILNSIVTIILLILCGILAILLLPFAVFFGLLDNFRGWYERKL